MKRNSVYITWAGENLRNTPQNSIERFRCKDFNKAEILVAKRQKENIKKAIFIDENGNTVTL